MQQKLPLLTLFFNFEDVEDLAYLLVEGEDDGLSFAGTLGIFCTVLVLRLFEGTLRFCYFLSYSTYLCKLVELFELLDTKFEVKGNEDSVWITPPPPLDFLKEGSLDSKKPGVPEPCLCKFVFELVLDICFVPAGDAVCFLDFTGALGTLSFSLNKKFLIY